MIMVKPGMPYLDVVHNVKKTVSHLLAKSHDLLYFSIQIIH